MSNAVYAESAASRGIVHAGIRLARDAARTIFAVTVALSLACVIEFTARGSFEAAVGFFMQSDRPGIATVTLILLSISLLDGLLGRRYQALLILAPALLGLAWLSRQKMYYIKDPLYPTDFLFYRQVVDLMPILVRDRPLTAAAMVMVATLSGASMILAWRVWRRRGSRLTVFGRLVRLAIAIPSLAYVATIIDNGLPPWARHDLKVVPIVWNQPVNYENNGFLLAFVSNAPMAKIFEPAGYGLHAIEDIGATRAGLASPLEKPDVIVVMSEAFWDTSRLPGVAIVPDPLPTVRELLSGHVFSPQFGGSTANVEFEALTGFTNAFLPNGSMPYQQYIRGPLPSLASMFRYEGYATTAVHPYAAWFWNRTAVYEAFGFERFVSAETMVDAPMRGPFISDEAMVDEIIGAVETDSRPAFIFAVSMQGHGPYEANRYPWPDHAVVAPTLSEGSRASLVTYAQGVAEADQAFRRLIRWARQRARPTVVAMFGDHLPALGQIYNETDYLGKGIDKARETPLVIWSNRGGGAKDIGTISPIFLPLHLLRGAGFGHPYYTEFLAELHEQFRVIDRNLLLAPDGQSLDWDRRELLSSTLTDYRLLQYDMLFGEKWGASRFFPVPNATAD